MQPRKHENTKKKHWVCFVSSWLRGWIFTGFAVVVVVAQQPAQPTFRTGQTLIVQTVTVKDKDGKPVEGLTARDFTITEDGEPQAITFVEFQRLPGPATTSPVNGAQPAAAAQPAAPASPDTPAAPAPFVAAAGPAATVQQLISVPPPGDTRYRDRRLIVLYFDPSAISPLDQTRAYANALKWVDTQMGPADVAAIITFQKGAVRVRQDFTSSRALLREVIQTLIFGDDADGDGIPDPLPGTAFGQDEGEFNIFNTDRQLSALQTAVTMLRPLPEQKSLIFFASGLRLNGTDNQAQLRATVNAAIRSNVTIHTIDARGLVATPPLGDATRPSQGGIGMFNGRFADTVNTTFQRSQDSLYALAKDTGGRAMFDYNDLSLGIVQAADSMTSYYLIGYYSTHAAQDGRFRRVKVSLNGGVAGELSYRQGYFADKTFAKFTAADKERQLEDALMLENPVTDIPIAMEVNYFQLNSAQYFIPVAVKIPGSELALARRGGAQRTLIDFIGEVKDDYGYTMQNVRDKLDMKLNDETAAQLATHPIQYQTGFTLLPGKYVIKLLARDSETGRMGTYQASFTVPNLVKELKRVPISSVVLSGQRVPLSDSLYTVQQKLEAESVDPLVYEGQKLIPSVTRVFSKGRDLYVFLQAYQRGATATQPLVAFVTFYRGQVKAFETPPLAVTEGLDAKTKAVPLRFSLSVNDLPPGPYDCQVTVLDPTGQKAAFWQAPIVLIP
jgi:VWFA-related protein